MLLVDLWGAWQVVDGLQASHCSGKGRMGGRQGLRPECGIMPRPQCCCSAASPGHRLSWSSGSCSCRNCDRRSRGRGRGRGRGKLPKASSSSKRIRSAGSSKAFASSRCFDGAGEAREELLAECFTLFHRLFKTVFFQFFHHPRIRISESRSSIISGVFQYLLPPHFGCAAACFHSRCEYAALLRALDIGRDNKPAPLRSTRPPAAR